MSEVVVNFGPEQGLVGTLSIPTQVAPRGIGFILLNAGVISRMGPHRFNVKLARHLASLGFACLRFDLAGQGDSQANGGAQSYEQQVMLDLRAAVDHLTEQTGVRHVAIAGICSGAVAAHTYAQQDDRVMACWMYDGYAYSTRLAVFMRMAKQLRHQPWLTLKTWLQRIKERLAPPALAEKTEENVDFGSHNPDKRTYAEALLRMHERGVRLFMMFSSDILWYYSYQNQFRDAFKGWAFADAVRVQYLPDVDHTITTLAWQQRVISDIGDWAVTLPTARANG